MKIGKYRLTYSEGNPNIRTFYVVAIVEGMAVTRQWWRGKQSWRYTVEHPYFFKINEEYLTYVSDKVKVMK